MHMDIPYPIRINRYLYLNGYCSRREADRLIKEKRVRINERCAVVGDTVDRRDIVHVDKHIADLPKEYVYYAYNKPVGVVSNNPQDNEQGIDDVVRFPKKVFPTGRLDKNSHGLMLLSNDGRIVDKLLNPKYAHEKEYHVQTDKPITQKLLRNFQKGVSIEGYKTKPAKAMERSPYSFSLILTEGKKHQIRRMCAAYGYQVRDLKRVRIMHIVLGKLKHGEYRALSTQEKERLLSLLGIRVLQKK
jgi:23S rRNA pseudouridine2604 synthase